ncbi:MAG: protein kinase [Planctomycetes bacterium]|nr:protein kinase [Planctomycetota bacterium]
MQLPPAGVSAQQAGSSGPNQTQADLPPASVGDDSAGKSSFVESGSESPSADAGNSQTMISDEWDSPSATFASDDQTSLPIAGSTSVQLLPDADDRGGAAIDRTVQSDEFSPGGSSDSSEGSDPNLSKTFISDEFDEGVNFRTLQMDEDLPQGNDFVDKTVQFEGIEEGPGLEKTVQSEGFVLDDASPAQIDRTLISDSFDEADVGLEATMQSDDVSPGLVRTMQDMWSGAFEARTSPGMTIKGKTTKDEKGQTSLVIRERSMVSPGEQKPKGYAAEYELIKILGEGGMGVVYDARQMSVDRSVAVKMLKGKTAGDEKQRQKFLAEAVVTGELDHPNIVPIYDVGTSDRGLLFYSMKKVKWTPWNKLVTRKSVDENIEILMKVADAVAFAHSRGVIHRDLKPENIMLGEFGETLVMDWGLALPVSGYAKANSISITHSMGGTPAYMAPEMASGPLEKITIASDVYLLGAMLYEILTGKAPHTGKNTMQCLFAAAKNEIRPPETDNVPEELMAIALKAMATDARDRYPRVEDFQQAIRDYRSHSESFILSSRAAEELENGENTGDYASFNRAQFGFEEALKQWDGNNRARNGLSETKQKYATLALTKGDFDLGLGLLDVSDPSHLAISAQLQKAKRERESKARTLKRLKQGAVAAVVLFILGGTGAGIWINAERLRAEHQKELAVKAREDAEKAEQEALDRKEEAENAKQDALDQKEIAVEATNVAMSEKIMADMARDKAKEQEEIAKRETVRAEYEGYVAQIGLASAKIEENSFQAAYDLLQGCKKNLRNWEWGRLMYLCGLSIKNVDTQSPLAALAIAPDGKQFITGGSNGAAKIWDTEKWSELRALPVTAKLVFAVAYSPDGKIIATAGNDNRVQLWEAATGKLIETAGQFRGHKDGVLSVRFSRDGSKLLTASYDKTARLWDVKTGNELQTLGAHSWWVWSAEFSPDEQRIVSVSQDGSAIVWDYDSKSDRYRRGGQFLEHSGAVYSVAFSPDSKYVATGGYDTRILVWRPQDVRPFDLKVLVNNQKASREAVPFREFSGHEGPVRSVSFSQDGSLVLTGSHDNTVRIWSFKDLSDVKAAHAIKTLRGHASRVRATAFTADGKVAFSASEDQTAKSWNIDNYAELRMLQGLVLTGHKDDVLSVSFTRDGKKLVTASRDKSAMTWNFATGEKLRSFREGHEFLAANAAFLDDKRMVTAAVDNTLRVWDIGAGTQISHFDHTGRSAALAIGPGGHWILTGGEKVALGKDGKNAEWVAQVWDVATQQCLRKLRGHHFEVTSVAVSPDGKWAFTGDSAGFGMLWNAATWEPLQKSRSHAGKISGAVFLADSSRLLTASIDNTVAQWDVATGRHDPQRNLKHSASVLSLALVPGTRQAITCTLEKEVTVWDVDAVKALGTLPAPAVGTVERVAVSSDGQEFITVNPVEKTVRRWKLPELTEIVREGTATAFLKLEDQSADRLASAVYVPNADSIVTLRGSGALLWDRNARQQEPRMNFNPVGIFATANFSPDGQFVVTASWDNVARIWNAETGVDVRKLEGHTGRINSANYSPDGQFIVTASDDKTVMVWKAATGERMLHLQGHTDRVRSAVFSPDGQVILTASNDGTARLWSAEAGTELQAFHPPKNKEGTVFALLCAAFSGDGARIVTGCEDRNARIWNVESGELELEMAGHTAPVSSVAFFPGNERALTGSLDNTAKVWDTKLTDNEQKKGKEILTLKHHTKEVTCVAVSADGRYVGTSSRDGTAIVWLAEEWNVNSDDAPQQAAAGGSVRKTLSH